MATVYPSVRIDEVGPTNRLVLLSSEKQKRVEYRVLVYGSAASPPIDLERGELHSSVAVSWTGPKEEYPPEEGLSVQSCRLVALLEPSGAPVLERTRSSYGIAHECCSPMS